MPSVESILLAAMSQTHKHASMQHQALGDKATDRNSATQPLYTEASAISSTTEACYALRKHAKTNCNM